MLNQEVILLGENQESEPVQEKNKLLHVSLWLHSTAGASGSRDLREAEASPWLGVMAASWAEVTNDIFFLQSEGGNVPSVNSQASFQWTAEVNTMPGDRELNNHKTYLHLQPPPISARQFCERDQSGSEFTALHDYILRKDTLAEKLWGISKTFIMTYYHGCFLLDIPSLTSLLIFIAAITKMSAICLQSLSPGQKGCRSREGEGLMETLVYCGDLATVVAVLKLIKQVVSFKRNTPRWKGKHMLQSKARLGGK